MKFTTWFFLFILVVEINLVKASQSTIRQSNYFESCIGCIVCNYNIIRPPDQTNKKKYDEHMNKVKFGKYVDFAQFFGLSVKGDPSINLSSYRVISACRNTEEFCESGYFIERLVGTSFIREEKVYSSPEEAFDALIRSCRV